MKLERLRDKIEEILEQTADDIEEVLSEWVPWDDEYGEDKTETGSDIPEGMHLTVSLDLDEESIKEKQIEFPITGSVTLERY